MLKAMSSSPPVVFASWMAWNSDPAPVAAALVTVKVASTWRQLSWTGLVMATLASTDQAFTGGASVKGKRS